ncbi:alpha-tocopherol transfer protein-like [Zerene cesonia]|uniref:alpha-tocopherol transfer protein-like n=1 Tax=Zerene cesonia TaxID=33412 RepID=UPI0018E565B8|nr:alpha-tocopherol transfer protein-like [Zerene cesonia]
MVAGEILPFPLEDEYKKNTGITPADVKELRRWLKTQPHLPDDHITDMDLILAYHSCNRSTGVTKQVIDLHFTLKTLFTQYFKDRRFDAGVERTLNNLLLTLLPTRTKEGYAIFYTHFLNTDPKAFVFTDAIKAAFMVLEFYQYEEGTWPGVTFVIDFEGMTLGHVARIDLINLQQYLYYLQEAMLVKLMHLNFINAPSFIDRVVMMMKPFLKKEMMDILRIHTVGSDSVRQHIPMEALPKDFGGSYKSSSECRDELISKLRANASFFENENKKRVVESRRPGKPKTISDIFGGLEGSFKKLDID